jgi:hypothetical protein
MQFHVAKLGIQAEEHVGGNVYTMNRKEVIKTFTNDEKSANLLAQKQATENPGQQFAVFGIVRIYETTKPTFIEKIVNDSGEVVVKPKDGAAV